MTTCGHVDLWLSVCIVSSCHHVPSSRIVGVCASLVGFPWFSQPPCPPSVFVPMSCPGLYLSTLYYLSSVVSVCLLSHSGCDALLFVILVGVPLMDKVSLTQCDVFCVTLTLPSPACQVHKESKE